MDIAQSRPRFRTDLVAQPIDEGGQRFVDVTDPDSGKTFRFYEVEYSIACALDGQKDLADLLDWAQSELGLQPSPEELQSVVNTLADLGYLADSPEAIALPPRLDDLTLGHAGAKEVSASHLPSGVDLELGLAGSVGMRPREEETFVAPSLSLGQAGNERVTPSQPDIPVKTEQSFAGLMDDDEDHVPTTIKRPSQVVGAKEPDLTPAPPADPAAVEASLQPTARKPDDDDDGPTNLPPPSPPEFDDEVSVDLSDHLHLGPDAVKEAVRQSKLMQAAEPEPASLDEVEEIDVKESAPPRARPPVPGAESTSSREEPEPVQLPAKPIVVSRPVEPIEERKSGNAKTQPQGSRTGLLIVVLLVVLGAAAAAVYVLNLFEIRARLGLEKAEEQPIPVKQPEVVEPTPEVKKPELPMATLEVGDAPVVEVKAPQKGALASILASGTEAKEGDVVARLKGIEAIEKRVAEHKDREAVYQAKLDKALESKTQAEAAGNAAVAKKFQSEADKAQKKVEEKQQLRVAEEEKLAPFVIKAPVAGVIETGLEDGASFAQDAVVFSVKGTPAIKATFTLTDSKDVSEGGEVEVVSKADDKKRLDCKITKVDGAQVTVECPSGGALSAGDQVALSP